MDTVEQIVDRKMARAAKLGQVHMDTPNGILIINCLGIERLGSEYTVVKYGGSILLKEVDADAARTFLIAEKSRAKEQNGRR